MRDLSRKTFFFTSSALKPWKGSERRRSEHVHRSGPFSFEHSLIVMSCVVFCDVSKSLLEVQLLSSSLGRERGAVLLRTGAGHNCKFLFHSVGTWQNREKNVACH